MPDREAQVACYNWTGSIKTYLDTPHVVKVNKVSVGHYGGNTTKGADKNEDAALIWISEDGEWEFVTLLDAHNTASSAELVINRLETHYSHLKTILNGPISSSFQTLHLYLLELFSSEQFRFECKEVQGETSCLICVRKGPYLGWFNIGDCSLYLLHPDLLQLGQSALNQRNFYEWIGQVNTFDKSVPCYSSGVRELRRGKNVILLTTDGIFEADNEFNRFMSLAYSSEGVKVLRDLLDIAHESGVRDSATIILWDIDATHDTRYPYEQPNRR